MEYIRLPRVLCGRPNIHTYGVMIFGNQLQKGLPHFTETDNHDFFNLYSFRTPNLILENWNQEF